MGTIMVMRSTFKVKTLWYISAKRDVCILQLNLGFENVKKNRKETRQLITMIVRVIELWVILLFSQSVRTMRCFYNKENMYDERHGAKSFFS